SRKDSASLEEDINTHLSLLGVRALDLVYLDPPPEETGVGPLLQTLVANVRHGRIRAYGLRNWTAQQIRAAVALARSEEWPLPAALVTTELSSAIPNQPLWEGYIPFDGALRDAARAFDLTVWAWLTDINQAPFAPPNGRAPFLSAERM